jgi:parallel beta-helix repeat protein
MKSKIILVLILILIISGSSITGAIQKKININDKIIDKNNDFFLILGKISANILYVGGDGPDNYSKIQDAINDASAGDTIFVYNKTYHEQLTINLNVNLIGENNETTVIDGDFASNIITILADGVKFSKFTIKNCGNGKNDCIFKINSKGNILQDNIFVCDDKLLKNQLAINILPGADDNQIINNQIYYCDAGIHIKSSNNIILKNKIRDCGLESIWIQTDLASEKTSKNNTIMNNTIFEVDDQLIGYGYGIWIHRSCENKIIRNSISNKYFALHMELQSDGCIVQYNTFSNNRGYGVGIAKSSNCNVSFNNINENQGFGIGLDYRTNQDNTIYHNNFIDNKLNAYARKCQNIKWIENYYSDWKGLKFKVLRFLPYFITRGTILNGRIKLPRLSFSNIDWHPALTPYDI